MVSADLYQAVAGRVYRGKTPSRHRSSCPRLEIELMAHPVGFWTTYADIPVHFRAFAPLKHNRELNPETLGAILERVSTDFRDRVPTFSGARCPDNEGMTEVGLMGMFEGEDEEKDQCFQTALYRLKLVEA